MVFIVFNCKYTYNLQTCQIVVLKSCLCVLLFLSRNNVSFHYSFQLVLCMFIFLFQGQKVICIDLFSRVKIFIFMKKNISVRENNLRECSFYMKKVVCLGSFSYTLSA